MGTIENSGSKKFEIEDIDDTQKLYYRIHKVNVDEEIDDEKLKIKPAAFDPMPKPHSVKMSVNWAKYSSAIQTQKSAKKRENNGVLSFLAYDVRNKPVNLKVTHAPSHNQSHSLIHDVLSEANDPQIRLQLRNICKWEIKI